MGPIQQKLKDRADAELSKNKSDKTEYLFLVYTTNQRGHLLGDSDEIDDIINVVYATKAEIKKADYYSGMAGLGHFYKQVTPQQARDMINVAIKHEQKEIEHEQKEIAKLKNLLTKI